MKYKKSTKITFRHKDIIYFGLIMCLLYISATGDLKNYITPNLIIRACITVSMCGVVFFLNLKQKRHNSAIFVWMISAVFIFLWNSAYVEDGNYNFILIYICMLLLVCCAKTTHEWIGAYLKAARSIYFFYAICTIAFYFMPSFYYNKIVPLFPETQSRLISWYKNGCMAGLTSHYSTNGMFMALGTIILIIVNIEKNKKRKSDIITLIIFIIALLLTGKRAHALFTIMASAVVYYFHLSNEKKTRAVKIFGAILLGTGAFFILINVVPALSTFVVRMGSDSISSRTIMWGWAFDAFKEHPILGIGWGQFRDLTTGRLSWGVMEAHAHNTYVQLLCETGLVGFTLYIIWMGYMLYTTMWLYAYLRTFPNANENERIYVGFALGVQVFFLLYCITGNPLYDYEMFIPYYISCAVAECYRERFGIR